MPRRARRPRSNRSGRPTSKLKNRRHRQDAFWKRAKAANYAARSVFKLEEIDTRSRLFPVGARVLDLGCRPGSWLQYVAKQIGSGGALVGIDRTPLDIQIPRARLLVGDAFAIAPAELRGDLSAFDVVLSDMAPDTSGIRSVDQARSEALFERALELALELLAPGGHFVGKLFQGPDFQRLIQRTRTEFEKVTIKKPASSRKDSIEVYVVAVGFLNKE